MQLKGNDHHKAAYLFAVYNLAALVNKLPEELCEEFTNVYADRITPDLVLQYIAAAHHLPANARKAFESYATQVSNFHDSNLDPKKKPKKIVPFVGHAQAAGVGRYVRKTEDNRKALKYSRGW